MPVVFDSPSFLSSTSTPRDETQHPIINEGIEKRFQFNRFNDIHLFLVMDDSFNVSELSGETVIFFDHMAAHNYEGASIFWVRGAAALGGVHAAVEHWQLKRDGKRRGIVEVVSDDKK